MPSTELPLTVEAIAEASRDEHVPASAPMAADPVPLPAELEAMLADILAQVRRLTAEPTLLSAATNLLNDCREIWREGQHTTAMFLARDYVTRIPAYIVVKTASTRKAP